MNIDSVDMNGKCTGHEHGQHGHEVDPGNSHVQLRHAAAQGKRSSMRLLF